MKTILFVILQQYADWEAAYITSAITMLGQGQYDIKTVSLSKDYLNVASEEKVSEWYNFHKLGYYTASMPKM